jgi:hypothetical protein
VRLLHNNALVHTAGVAKAAFRECGFIELNRPLYSSDLAPSDYSLFAKLKLGLRERRFKKYSEVNLADYAQKTKHPIIF